MGRKTKLTQIFKGKIIFNSAFHTGSGRADIDTDSCIVRDSEGKAFIPGSSIAGVCRAMLYKFYSQKPENQKTIDKLFGSKDNGKAFLTFQNATFCSPTDIKQIRDGVGISRDTLTAADKCKYDFEILPFDTAFDMEMWLELPEGESINVYTPFISTILNEWRHGRIWLGAQTSRGLGWNTLEDVNVYDLNSPQTYLEYINDKNFSKLSSTEFEYKPIEIDEPYSWGKIDLDIKINDISGLVIKSSEPEGDSEEDVTFIKIQSYEKNIEFIPGASLKGAFRNRAEQILRTLGVPACYPVGEPPKDDKLAISACHKEEHPICSVCFLFGTGELKAGRIYFKDAYADKNIDTKKLDYVAINRFTGGALDSAKFDAKIGIDGTFKTSIYLDNPEIYEIALIAHVLKDLLLQDIRIGYGKFKGYGKVKANIDKITIGGSEKSKIYKLLSQNSIEMSKNFMWHELELDYIELDKWKTEKQGLIGDLDKEFIDFINLRRIDG